jgi:hypothetical protein
VPRAGFGHILVTSVMKPLVFHNTRWTGPSVKAQLRWQNLGFANTGQHGAYLDDTQGVVGSSPARPTTEFIIR